MASSVVDVDLVQPNTEPDTTTSRDGPNPTITEPELPKPWSIEDPFQYVPPKTEVDHWDLLLQPCVKEDQRRCDAWKDEVQNLLIFAGLFSAVVTAFIIESYKNLQQSPNDVMIALLAHIAVRLDGPLNNTSSVPLPIQTPFVPRASTIRVNNFWFISLVLSLTTVLVGIVALQWLREHQHYPSLSSRERYAVSVMRNKALSRWHVDKFFTAMPLLLQFALILFLGGVVDFIHGLGDRNVLIPVTIVVAFTLAFIVATTVLPSLQVLYLYFNPPNIGQAKGRWANPPCPCPYKSPQSHAFRQLVHPLAILCDRLFPHLRSALHVIRHRIRNAFSSMTIPALEVDDFTRYLSPTLMSEDWINFDLAWLAIRDGYSRRAHARSSMDEFVGRSWKVNILLGGRDNEIVPITDILSGMQSQAYHKDTSASAYHAFCEISELTLLPLQRPDYYYRTSEELCRQSAYLHDLLTGGIDEEAILTDIFDFNELLFNPLRGENQTTLDNIPAMLLHHQNTSLYLQYHFTSEAPLLSTHRTELGVRLIRYFCLQHPETRDVIANANLRYPGCLVLTRFDSYLGPDFKEVDFTAVAWQVGNTILLVLQQLRVNHEHESRDRPNTFLNILFAQGTLTSFMDTASFFTTRSLKDTRPPEICDKLELAVRDTFHAIPSFFEGRLNKEMLSWRSAEGRPTLIFYLAAIYIQPLIDSLQQNSTLLALYSTVCKYRRRTIDMGITDPDIEERLNEDPNVKYYFLHDHRLFSTQWWQEFDPPDSLSSSTSHGRNTPSIVMYYPFSTSENSLAGNEA